MTVPYTAADPWPRLVILAGGGAARRLRGADRVRGGRRPRRRAPAPPARCRWPRWCCCSWSPRSRGSCPTRYLRGAALRRAGGRLPVARAASRPRSATRAAALVAGAVGLGLLAAPLLDRQTPILDVNDLADSIAPARGTTFDWNHRYGPLNWPRDGREVLRIKAAHAAYWKAENLDGFDGLRWLHVRGRRGRGGPARLLHPPRLDAERAGHRPRAAAPISSSARAARWRSAMRAPAPVAAGSPGTYDADTPAAPRRLLRGPRLHAAPHRPRPGVRQHPRAARRRRRTRRLAAVRVPDARAAGPCAPAGATRRGPRSPRRARATWPSRRSASGGAPARVLRGVVLGDGEAALRASPYAQTYALARRLAARRAHAVPVRARRRGLPLAGVQLQRDAAPARGAAGELPVRTDRTGYCQQFSGAMALLLRMGGVPGARGHRLRARRLQPLARRVRGPRRRRPLLGRGLLRALRLGAVRPDARRPRRRASQASFGATASAGTPDPRDTGAGRHPTPKATAAFSTGGDSGPGALPVLAVVALVIAVLAAVAAGPARDGGAATGRRATRALAELERALRAHRPPRAARNDAARARAPLRRACPAPPAYLRALRGASLRRDGAAADSGAAPRAAPRAGPRPRSPGPRACALGAFLRRLH